MKARSCLFTALSVMLLTAPLYAHPPRATGNRVAAAGVEQRIAAYADRVRDRPDDSVALARLAKARLELARITGQHVDFQYAGATFRTLIEREPHSAAGFTGLAYVCLGTHRFGEALDLARQAEERRPGENDVLALLADIHLALGHVGEAEALVDRLVASELRLPSLARRGLVRELRGDLEGARTDFDDAVRAGELLGAPAADRAWCHQMRAELELDAGDLAAAETACAAARALVPDSVAAHAVAAEIATRRGDLTTARELLEAIEPRAHPRHWVQLGGVVAALGDTVRADQLYDRAEAAMEHELKSGETGHVRDLIEFQLTHDRNVPAARLVELALRELHEVRQDAQTYATAAWALYRAGRATEAVPLIESALRRDRSASTIRTRAKAILRACGRDLEADHLAAR